MTATIDATRLPAPSWCETDSQDSSPMSLSLSVLSTWAQPPIDTFLPLDGGEQDSPFSLLNAIAKQNLSLHMKWASRRPSSLNSFAARKTAAVRRIRKRKFFFRHYFVCLCVAHHSELNVNANTQQQHSLAHFRETCQ